MKGNELKLRRDLNTVNIFDFKLYHTIKKSNIKIMVLDLYFKYHNKVLKYFFSTLK